MKINVIIRTSKRPQLFDRCINSVLNQSVKSNIIVSVDNDEDYKYISGFPCKTIRVAPRKEFPTYWNLYLNFMIQQVDGFCIILDDDDYFINDKVIETISKIAIKRTEILVYKMRWSNGRLIPGDKFFGKLPFKRGEIGMPCVMFHSSWIEEFKFDGNKAGDFRFFNKLISKVSRTLFLEKTLIQIGNTGLNGKIE